MSTHHHIPETYVSLVSVKLTSYADNLAVTTALVAAVIGYSIYYEYNQRQAQREVERAAEEKQQKMT
jgi:uncharacterized membrane protein YkvA (DUF1232 family)